MTPEQQTEQMMTDTRNQLAAARIDLDAFLACDADERGRRWRAWYSAADKADLVRQTLTRRGVEWDAEIIAHWVAHYDAKWGASDPAPAGMPPAGVLAEAAAELARAAQFAGDRANANALNKAAAAIAEGVALTWSAGDLLVPSRTTDGAVYRVTGQGCSCKAGVNGRACWHAAVWEIIARAWELVNAQDDGLESAADCGGTLPDDEAAWADLLARAPEPAPEPELLPMGVRLAAARARIAA